MLRAKIVSGPRHAIVRPSLAPSRARDRARPPKPNGVFVVAETAAAAPLFHTGGGFLALGQIGGENSSHIEQGRRTRSEKSMYRVKGKHYLVTK